MENKTIDSTKFKAVLFKSKTLANGSHPVLIRITKNRKLAYISLGYCLRPENWNEAESKAWESVPRITDKVKLTTEPYKLGLLRELYSSIEIHPEAKVINRRISEECAKITLVIREMEVNKIPIDTESIKKRLEPKVEKDSNKSYLAYFKKYTQNLFNTGKFGTWNRFDNAYRKLLAYMLNKDLRGKYKTEELELALGKKDILFKDLSAEFLSVFEHKLRQSGLASMSIESVTKTLKSVFETARRDKDLEGQITNNPFSVYTVTKGKAKTPTRLTPDEITILECLDLDENTQLCHIRNAFLFSYYCAGIRIGDLLQLKWSNIRQGRLTYDMDKTDEEQDIKLFDKALGILDRYTDRKDSQKYVFPFFNPKGEQGSFDYKQQLDSKAAIINKGLKQIAAIAGINKKITFHVSRHSFFDNARQKDISIYDLMQLARHSNIAITERYLATLDKKSKDEALGKAMNG